MKNIKGLLLLMLCMSFILSACGKNAKLDVSLDYVADEIKKTANIKDMKEEKINSMSVAKLYGVSEEILESGLVLSSKNDSIADEVILLKAKDQKSILDLERSMQREIEALSKAWEKNDEQYEIVKNHIVKTSGKFVILVISEKVNEIEEMFDRLTTLG